MEDDREIRESFEMVLEEAGYRVISADNGLGAMEVLRSGKTPDLIVLDLRMPIMDGWEFRMLQKSDPALAAIPLVAMSADGSAKAAAIDAQAYLRKPLSAATLLETIARILSEAELKVLARRLEEAERFAALGRLAATVGHEINNPLAYLTINVGLVARDLAQIAENSATGMVKTNAQQLERMKELLEDCRVGLDRIRDVVGNLKSLSRPATPNRGALSLNDVLDRAIAMSRYAAEHRATIVRSFGELPPVIGDLSALGQVFLNLLLNAAQALPEGRANEHEIVIRSFALGSEVIVEITDTGPGILPETLPHIFEPFFTTKAMGDGTGLGLSISRRIVEDHGGRIEARNNRDRGATFRVTLPVGGGDPPAALAEDPPEPAVAPSSRARVLVIDDEPLIGRTIQAALAGDHDVTIMSLASEAFARLESGETFDVVLCDLLMPEMSGREVYEQLVSNWPAIARGFIFMTGGAFTVEASDFLSRTGRRVLFKPFRIDELRATIRAQLDEQVERHN